MTYIEHLQESDQPEDKKKLEKLEQLATMMVNGANKGQMMNIVFGENSKKVDSAYPQSYADSIREIFPNFRKGNYCYSYIEQPSFGELVNVNDLLVEWIFKSEE